MIKNFITEKEGFSLIELIVVITIIAVITAIGTVSFTSANKKSRDGKRLADLERIRMALEVARQVGTTYPASQGTLVPEYLASYPVGPSGVTETYSYTRGVTGYTYTLDAWVEVQAATGSYGSCGTVNGVAVTCNYRVTQP